MEYRVPKGFDTAKERPDGLVYLLFTGDCRAVAEAQPGVVGKEAQKSIEVHGVHPLKDSFDQIGRFGVHGFPWFCYMSGPEQRKGPDIMLGQQQCEHQHR